MGNYASSAKLSELRLADEPEATAEGAPGGHDAPMPSSDATPPVQSTETVPGAKVAALRLAEEPDLPPLDFATVETRDSTADSGGHDARDQTASQGARPSQPASASENPESAEPAKGGGDPPATVAVAEQVGDSGRMTKYLAAAAREFYDGQIDQPLWLRAVQQSGADEAAARAAYIRARAAAMRVAKREQPSRNDRLAEPTVSHSRGARRSENSSKARRAYRTWRINRTALIVIALAIGVPAAGIVGYSLAPQATGASAAPAPSGNSAQTRLLDTAKSAVTKARAAERPNVSGDDLARKVQELKDSGNWNVMVLYATEWTRKLPASPDAWNELSMGYVKLRQFNDALEAATKAVQLAPENPHAWQNLGEVNVALQLPAAALTAYERAVELNARDVTSLVQVGLLNAQLGQSAQARAAFGKALDVNPLDADALCGAATTAQRDGRAKDADAYVRQLKSASLQCRTAGASEPVSVTAASAAKKKP